jgi:hypothetical protein
MTKPRTSSRRVIAPFLLVVTLASTPLVLAQVGYSPRAKEIGMHLKCLCGGCEMSAGGCSHPGAPFSGPCPAWALPALHEVDSLLAQGKTEQQIINAFVAKYGPAVYVEPPKKGFALLAWLMPLVYVLVGLALVVYVVRKWARRPGAPVPAVPGVPNEALDRVRAQVDKETDD